MLNVLIVDDDTRFTTALSEYMQAEGFSVRVAGTLQQAKNEFANYPPSVVLVDLLLPDGRGLDLLDEFENTEALVMTSYPSVDTAVEGLRKKVSDYLTKPLDMSRLKECLHRLKSNQNQHAGVDKPGDVAVGKDSAADPATGHVSQLLSLLAHRAGNHASQPAPGASLEDVERNLIFATLERFEGNKRLTAESLGVSLKTLYNKLKRYGEEKTGT